MFISLLFLLLLLLLLLLLHARVLCFFSNMGSQLTIRPLLEGGGDTGTGDPSANPLTRDPLKEPLFDGESGG